MKKIARELELHDEFAASGSAPPLIAEARRSAGLEWQLESADHSASEPS